MNSRISSLTMNNPSPPQADHGRTKFWLRTLRSLPRFVVGAIFVAALAACPLCLVGEEIDRLLAAVNGKVITEGDLRLARNLNAVSALGRMSPPATRIEELNRILDLELLRQELANFPGIQLDESKIESQMSELRRAYAEIGGLPALLRRLGLQESELRSYVALQVSVMSFIEFRFRPFLTISSEEKQAYYEKKLVPQMQKSLGSKIPTLEEVSDRIEEIITQEKIDQSMATWLQDIRKHARIEFFNGANTLSAGSRQ